MLKRYWHASKCFENTTAAAADAIRYNFPPLIFPSTDRLIKPKIHYSFVPQDIRAGYICMQIVNLFKTHASIKILPPLSVIPTGRRKIIAKGQDAAREKRFMNEATAATICLYQTDE